MHVAEFYINGDFMDQVSSKDHYSVKPLERVFYDAFGFFSPDAITCDSGEITLAVDENIYMPGVATISREQAAALEKVVRYLGGYIGHRESSDLYILPYNTSPEALQSSLTKFNRLNGNLSEAYQDPIERVAIVQNAINAAGAPHRHYTDEIEVRNPMLEAATALVLKRYGPDILLDDKEAVKAKLGAMYKELAPLTLSHGARGTVSIDLWGGSINDATVAGYIHRLSYAFMLGSKDPEKAEKEAALAKDVHAAALHLLRDRQREHIEATQEALTAASGLLGDLMAPEQEQQTGWAGKTRRGFPAPNPHPAWDMGK